MPAEQERRQLSVLFVRPVFGIGASFVRTDYALAEKHWRVTPFAFDLGDRWAGARLLKARAGHDACLVWFADAHAFWAVLGSRCLAPPTIIIPGGYELANLPEGGYGLRLESKSRWRQGLYALRHAARVLAVSDFHLRELRAAGVPEERLQRLYHGFLAPEPPAGGFAKTPTVVTIAPCPDMARVWRKGLETFARAAAAVPDADFVLVGAYAPEIGEHLQRLAAGRLTLTGRLEDAELQHLLFRAAVYCQLSATETFGCALAEAMLCECVPVVTDRGSLPEVAGEVGFYAPYGDAEQTAAQIERALASDRGPAARRYIQEQFPLDQRERGLVEAVHGVLRGAGRAGAGGSDSP
jgi:glycosyltransferase involved in cell wall biosynthesis